LEAKYRLRPFFESSGRKSSNAELTASPRVAGADQSPNAPAVSTNEAARLAIPAKQTAIPIRNLR
jgi:hypothetical protein